MDYRIETLDSFFNEWGHPKPASTEAEAIAQANDISEKEKLPARVIHDGKIIYVVNV